MFFLSFFLFLYSWEHLLTGSLRSLKMSTIVQDYFAFFCGNSEPRTRIHFVYKNAGHGSFWWRKRTRKAATMLKSFLFFIFCNVSETTAKSCMNTRDRKKKNIICEYFYVFQLPLHPPWKHLINNGRNIVPCTLRKYLVCVWSTELKHGILPTLSFPYLFRYKSWRAGVLPVEREEGGGGGQGTDTEPRGRQPSLHLRPHPTNGGPQVQQ